MTDVRTAFKKARTIIKESCGIGQFRGYALRMVNEMEELVLERPDDARKIIGDYYENRTGAKPYEHPGNTYLIKKARVILVCRDLLEGFRPKRKYMFGKDAIRSTAFAEQLGSYRGWMDSQGLSDATIETRLQRADVLFRHLEDNGITDVESLDANALAKFIACLDARYTAIGKSNILYTIRNLFSCPRIAAELSFDPFGLLTNLHTPKHNAIPSVYSTDEILATLEAVDRKTDAGRTVYLIIMLAAVYGLRSIDIKELKVGDVDFTADTITISQHKTGFPLVLPLVECVKLPLLDYMRNTRRSCGFDNVLIKHKGAPEPYSQKNHFGEMLRSAMERGGVVIGGRKAGLHSLRHSLATTMLASGIPANEIAGVLGHQSAHSTKNYIWSDIEGLRIAALDVN